MVITSLLVKHVVRTDFNDLTPEAVEAAKKGIVDTVGIMIGGSSVPGCQLVVEVIKDWGGKEESTIAVFGGKAPSHLCALANGAMARALDIDDVNDEFPLHPDTVIVPAALAVGERQHGISGRDFLTAVALGQDIIMRMASATKANPIFSGRFNLFKVFAATASAGKLMGLNQEKMANALGIAYSNMVGADAQSLHDGVMTSYIQEGEAAKAAIESAVFAEKGITGTKHLIQGHHGFFNAFEPDPNLDALTFELGKIFRGVGISIKPFASCRSTHEAIDLALQTIKDESIDPDSIDRITARVNDQTYHLACQPLDQKHRPKNRSEAQFSLPFTVATAIVRGDFFVDELSDEILNDPKILSLASKVNPVLDDACRTGSSTGSTILEIETRDGKVVSREKAFALGSPNNPMSMDACLEKFEKCVKYASRPFPRDQTEKLIRMLTEIEGVESIPKLVQLLVPRS